MARSKLARLRSAVADHEVPCTPEWCRAMRHARRAQGITQVALARMIGASQAAISELETAKAVQSKYVPAVALALGIPEPSAPVADDLEARWIAAGRALRARSEASLRALLEHVESLASPR